MIELTLAMLASAFLIAGLASAMLISGEALDDSGSSRARQIETAAVLQRITNDLRHATSFSERTATAVTFTVPDRTGDDQEETIRYAWGGNAGDSLTRRFNSSEPAVVAHDVQQFDFTSLTRTVTGTGFAKGVTGVTFHEFTEYKGNNVNSATVSTPTGTGTGDLLIAVVTVSDIYTSLGAPGGWTQLGVHQNGQITLGVFWKTATGSEPATHTFTWANNERTYAFLMRFSGQHATTPIGVYTPDVGLLMSSNPPAPAAAVAAENSLALRIGAFKDNDITVDSTGLAGHETITMDHGQGQVSGGAGYLANPPTTGVAAETFALTASEYWITATLIIAPAD